MKNFNVFNLPNRFQISLASVLTLACFLLAFSTSVFAQSELSASKLRLLKERKSLSDAARYHAAPDDLPFSAIKNQSRPAMADGNLDSTFNASVTEGFGYVNETVVQPDGKIIAVGLFQRANGTRTNGIARYNADGSLDAGFNAGTGANLVIRAVALQPDGKIIIGGAFTIFNGQTISRIARLNSDGSIDSSFSPSINFNNQINDVVVQPDGKILVGGLFSTSSSRFVRLNSNGALDVAFSGFSAPVHKIVLTSNGKILVGGDPGGMGRALTRINMDGTPDASFVPGTGPDSPVLDIVVQPDGKILASGFFLAYNGTATDGIVRVNDNGSLDTAFDFLPPNPAYYEVEALALQPDGKIIASYYVEDNTGGHGRVVRFNANASADSTFANGDAEDFFVTDINQLGNGKILLSGMFVAYNNQTHLRLAQLNSDGTLDNGFNASASTHGTVYAIKRQTDGKIVIGGDFEFVNGVRKSSLTRLNIDGTLDAGFNMEGRIIGDIFSMTIQPDNKIIAGGSFYVPNNVGVASITRLNPNGSFDAGFNYSAADIFLLFVYSIAVQPDGKILLGGNIATSTNFSSHTLTRLNSDGAVDSSFMMIPLNPGGTTRAVLVQPDGKIVIGGTFMSTMTFPRTGIARLNTNGTLDSGFNVNNGQVYALAQQADGKVIAGGQILRRHSGTDGAIDETFNPGTNVNNLIRAIEIQPDGKILIGGNFSAYNGTTTNRVARVSSDGSPDTNFNVGAGASGNVLSLALQTDGKILVGGQFLDFNGTEKFSLVRLQGANSVPRAPFDFDGDGKTDIAIFRPSGGEWWINRSSNGTGYALQFGSSSDKLTPVDFTGDGKTDVAFWRPATGEWFVMRSEDNSFYSFPFGANGDIRAPADFDGDNKADAAVFRPSDSTWYIRRSSDGGTTIQTFGQNGDVPVVADYDGDNKADIDIYRVSSGQWWIQRSTQGLIAFQFGNSTDKPVQGDYTGDGKADVALFRNGEWFVLRSENQSYYSFPFGTNGDTPAPGDYDGDGKFDATVFRASNNTWYSQRTTAGTLIQSFGQNGDIPVPNSFVP